MANGKESSQKEEPIGPPPIGNPKDWEEWGRKWEDWGEKFGDSMGARFCGREWRFHPGPSAGGIAFALFLLAWGVTWLGTELGMWSLEFPFVPAAIILIALAILFSELKKLFRKRG